MFKTLLVTSLFTLFIGVNSYAAEDVATVDYGKEKPKGFGFESDFNKGVNSFSLRSNRQYRGENVINNTLNTVNYLSTNTVIAAAKSQNSNVITLKKGLIIGNITFNPNDAVKSYNIR